MTAARAAAERREQETRRQREREQALAAAMDRADERHDPRRGDCGAARRARGRSRPSTGAAAADASTRPPSTWSAVLQRRSRGRGMRRRPRRRSLRCGRRSRLRPAHAEARRLLHEREEDLAREQAEARAEASCVSVRRRSPPPFGHAAAATSHAAALAALRTALDIDPNHPEARRLFDAREAALEHEQAVERRRQEIDAACREIDAQIDSGALDAAERGIAAFEREPDAKKAMKALRRRLQQEQAAAERREQEAQRQREREQALAECHGSRRERHDP